MVRTVRLIKITYILVNRIRDMARSSTSTGEKSTKGQNVLPQTLYAEWGPDNLKHPVPQLCKIFV